MVKKKVDAKLKLFMDFFSKELGCHFIDGDTGEVIDSWEEKDGEGTRK